MLAGLLALALAAQPDCRDLRVAPTHDYAFLVGSAPGPGGAWRWLRNGQPYQSGQSPQFLLLHADGAATVTDGEAPLRADRVSFHPGRWGSALAVEPGGLLAFAREGNLDLNEGTLEMWVAARADGDDPVYAARNHVLFHYRAPNGDNMTISHSRTAGLLYAGGTVRGQWESAYGGAASMREWRAGEWHHLAYTWSAEQNRMRFYVDGVLTADTNERRYWPPDAGGDRFSLGGDLGGAAAHFFIDEVRILSRAMEDAEVRANARRLEAPRDNEVWLPLAEVAAGDSLVLEFAGCASRPYVYPGIPVSDPDPPSTLLAAGTTELPFSVRSRAATSCAWAVGAPLEYAAMRAFGSGPGATHRATITGLSPAPARVNDVYVRCASQPDYLLHLRYRALTRVNPPFPRTGNLWGSAGIAAKGLDYAARIDLYLGANFTAAQIRKLRELNPEVLVLTSINVVENHGLPDDYYLKTIEGKLIEVWPGMFRLNLTKRHVAEY